MGSRWRQENYFRYARIHFDLDSHDTYATTDDDPTRLVPNPAKKHSLPGRTGHAGPLRTGRGRHRRRAAGREVPATRGSRS